MFAKLASTINQIKAITITEERKLVLLPLINFIQKKINSEQSISINFICTHNSRRSHLSQVWAQTAAAYYEIPNTNCYSGGTEETALFPKVIEILSKQGFNTTIISMGQNPVYAIKYSNNVMPIIGFSKKHNSPFNPASNFAAVMTCSQADNNCPLISGTEKRISITFEDPKTSDNTAAQDEIYTQRSTEIASEMFYVFSQIDLNKKV